MLNKKSFQWSDGAECRFSSSSSSSQNPAESSAHNASVPDELWAQRDQPALEDIK